MGTDAADFDIIAREIFAPVYPVIAKQIIEKTGITQGKCLDIGSGGGYLGLALAGISDLEICLFDKSADMLKIAAENISNAGLEGRVKTLHGDVQQIPFDDRCFDLVVSRGSLFFWEDPIIAFQEINRILAPGGIAYIGGGFGTYELMKQIDTQMLEKDPDWTITKKKRKEEKSSQLYREKLQSAGIKDFEIQEDDVGMWIVVRRSD